ncbi:hypothetical protein [Agromyces sp. Marseille-P2726]|uniref:hypothetical protein n=1 Tax=Agromyces sp. Marseille-P2726 TaxID=2709132 RepID=UPI0015704460|nr:hypothetical protein [Agromyces sp. Marseille-P2726]
MAGHHRAQWATAAVAAALISVAVPGPAFAAEFDLVVPAGAACDFELGVTVSGGSLITREFTDSDGNTVRTLAAGRGSDLTFTNVATDATVSLKGNGSVTSTTFHPDGSLTVRLTGHNVLILFPTDVPAGPSTTLHVGQVTYDVDVDEVFTITGSSGRTRDICDELS